MQLFQRITGFRGPRTKRAFWGFADQCLSSLSNFALSLLVARSATPSEFGAFAILLALYAITLQLSRGLTGIPLSVRFSSVPYATWQHQSASAAGAALTLGVSLGILSICAGLLVAGALGLALVAFGAILPGVVLQDTWRYCLVTHKRGQAAFLNDTVWAGAFLATVGGTSILVAVSPIHIVLLWGFSATLAACLGCYQVGVLPRPSKTRLWLSGTSSIGTRFTLDGLVTTGAAQGAFFLVGALLGLAALGSIRGAYTLLTPLNIFFFGVMLVGVPEASRMASRTHKHSIPNASLVSLALGTLALACGTALVLLPNAIGVAAIGSLWYSAEAFLIPMTVFMAFTGWQIGALTFLRGLGAARASLFVALLAMPITLGFTGVGAVLLGAQGAAWGLATGRLAAAALAWLALIGVSHNGFVQNRRTQQLYRFLKPLHDRV